MASHLQLGSDASAFRHKSIIHTTKESKPLALYKLPAPPPAASKDKQEYIKKRKEQEERQRAFENEPEPVFGDEPTAKEQLKALRKKIASAEIKEERAKRLAKQDLKEMKEYNESPTAPRSLPPKKIVSLDDKIAWYKEYTRKLRAGIDTSDMDAQLEAYAADKSQKKK